MKKSWFSRPGKRRAAIRAAALALGLAAFAGLAAPAAAAAPDWLRAAARAPLPKYPDDTNAVVLLSQQATTVHDNGEIKTVFRRAYKILRPQGRDVGTVTVYFDNETRLTFLKAWSIPAQGAEYEVKEKDAVETSLFAGALYGDTRYKLLRIPAAEPGNVVGYEYEQRRRAAIFEDVWAFQDEIPVRRAEFTLELPPGWEFKSHWVNRASKDPQPAGERRWFWQLEDVPAVEVEPAMPAWRAVAGRLGVVYYPSGGEFAGKSHATWRDVGVWYAQLASARRQSTPEIKQKAAELTAAEATVLERIRKLAAFVQRDIRYVAIEIGIGGYQPHPAQDVFVNRYGDCKDKVTLLSTMLREIGVDSYYVLIHTKRGVLAPDFPSPLSFNHVILAIRLPEDLPAGTFFAVQEHKQLGRLLFFDPTDSLTPLGHLPPTLQANHGLLVTDTGGELLELRLLPPGTNRLLRTGRLELSASGTLSGTVQEIRWGSLATESRATLLEATGPDRMKALESFLGMFLGGFRLTDAQGTNLENLDQNLVLSYRFVAENYAQAAGNLLLFRPRVLGQKSRDLLEGKERKQPVEFPDASLQSDTFEISLPEGYQVDELPPPVQAAYPFAEYKSSTEAAGKVIRYNRMYQIKQVRVPTDQLGELKKFFQQIAADEGASAVLKRAGP